MINNNNKDVKFYRTQNIEYESRLNPFQTYIFLYIHKIFANLFSANFLVTESESDVKIFNFNKFRWRISNKVESYKFQSFFSLDSDSVIQKTFREKILRKYNCWFGFSIKNIVLFFI